MMLAGVAVPHRLVLPIQGAHDRDMRRGAAMLVVGLTLGLAGQAAASSAPASTDAVALSPTAAAAMPLLYRNCTNYNAKYPHGVGRATARDKTRSGTPPVRTFKRSTRVFNLAMSYNKGLDRDKDFVACEKA
jgi:hypothetical protein